MAPTTTTPATATMFDVAAESSTLHAAPPSPTPLASLAQPGSNFPKVSNTKRQLKLKTANCKN